MSTQKQRHLAVTSETIDQASGFKTKASQTRLLISLVNALPGLDDLAADEAQQRYHAAIEMLAELRPGDGLEGMLLAQMIACHEAAMSCLSRAQNSKNAFQVRHENLKQAQKLLALYAKQMQALDKHRGRGQQKVTVKHVHVGSGGQAIVGNVNAGNKANETDRSTDADAVVGNGKKDAKPFEIMHSPGDIAALPDRARIKKPRQKRR